VDNLCYWDCDVDAFFVMHNPSQGNDDFAKKIVLAYGW
jgi:hypothetical protein